MGEERNIHETLLEVPVGVSRTNFGEKEQRVAASMSFEMEFVVCRALDSFRFCLIVPTNSFLRFIW
jgi:hypothetical protein